MVFFQRQVNDDDIELRNEEGGSCSRNSYFATASPENKGA
jgi:hypothetical protein